MFMGHFHRFDHCKIRGLGLDKRQMFDGGSAVPGKVDNFQPVISKHKRSAAEIHKDCGKRCGKRVNLAAKYDD